MNKKQEYKEALQQTEQQINQLSVQCERLIGAIFALQEVAQSEEVEEPTAEDLIQNRAGKFTNQDCLRIW